MLNLRSLSEFNQMQGGFILVIVQSKSVEATGYVSLKPRREVNIDTISKQHFKSQRKVRSSKK